MLLNNPDFFFDVNSSLLFFSQNNSILNRQVKFFKKHCNLKQTEAQKLVAYRYGYHSWGELKTKKIDCNREKAIKDIEVCRDFLKDLIKKHLPANELLLLEKIDPEPHSFSYHILNNSIEKASDWQISELYYRIFEDYEAKSIDTDHISWAFCLQEVDNSLISYVKRIQLKNFRSGYNPFINFPYFGIKFYTYIRIIDNQLLFSSRELDGLYCVAQNEYFSMFQEPWFTSYITGFIQYLLNSLQTAGIHGKLAIAKVYNEMLTPNEFSKKELKYGFNQKAPTQTINELNDKLSALGAKPAYSQNYIDNGSLVFTF